MSAELGALSTAALSIGFIHTLYGPDHYVPFVAMSRVGKWSLRKTILVTLLCGIGHVGSSIVIGFIGIACGIVIFQIESFEALRGDLAGWLLIAFGLVYFAWGVLRAIYNVPHRHLHIGVRGGLEAHAHENFGVHTHAEEIVPQADQALPSSNTAPSGKTAGRGTMTPWILLAVFVFGPCEPLVPLLMYPAAEANVWGVVCVAVLFGLITLATMTSMVVLMSLGTGSLYMRRFERYSHALAGAVVLACGLAVKLGL
jgi:sulfite exporter TauE/SafE